MSCWKIWHTSISFISLFISDAVEHNGLICFPGRFSLHGGKCLTGETLVLKQFSLCQKRLQLSVYVWYVCCMTVFSAQHGNQYDLFTSLQRYMEVSANLRDSYEDKDG